MKNNTLIVTLVIVVSCGFMLTALAQTSPTVELEMAEKKLLFGIGIEAKGRNIVSRNASEELITSVKKYSFSAIFPQVRQNADAFYISATEPLSPKIEAGYLDPLSDLIMLSHSLATGAQPLAVYPWLDILVAHNAREEAFPVANSVMKRHPEWLSKNVQGNEVDENNLYMLDPAIPEVQDYLINVIVEVVKKYTIDGIYLGSLHYLNKNWGYNPVSIEKFKKEFNRTVNPAPDDPDWSEWRRQQLNHFVKTLQTQVKQVKPEVKLLVGAITEGSAPTSAEEFKNSFVYQEALQDWPTWAEQGWIDAICLLNFRSELAQAAEFDKWTRFAISAKGQTKVYVGIAGFLNFTDELIRQISRAKQLDADGVIIYSYDQPSRDDREFALASAAKAAITPGFLVLPRAPIPEIELPVVATPAPPTTPTVEVKLTTPSLAAPAETPAVIEPAPTPVVTATPLPTVTPTPPPPMQLIYLANGSVIEGRILSKFKDKIIIETSEGVRLRLEQSEVLRVEAKE